MTITRISEDGRPEDRAKTLRATANSSLEKPKGFGTGWSKNSVRCRAAGETERGRFGNQTRWDKLGYHFAGTKVSRNAELRFSEIGSLERDRYR
jgi:hypothetical protein